jgi:multidrug resistance efflux pump
MSTSPSTGVEAVVVHAWKLRCCKGRGDGMEAAICGRGGCKPGAVGWTARVDVVGSRPGAAFDAKPNLRDTPSSRNSLTTRKMRRIPTSLILALVPLAMASCTGSHADRSASVEGAPLLDLRVRRGEFRNRVLLTGELQAVHAESITVPRVPKSQTSIRWMEADGARVVAGQKVVEFDNSAFVSDLEEKRLGLTQAAMDLEQKKAESAGQLAEKQFQAEQKRIAHEKARSDAEIPPELLKRREYEERRLARERARVEHEKALEDLHSFEKSSREDLTQRTIAVEKARREIEAAESAIRLLTGLAPRDGILVVANAWGGRKLQVGDPAWAGMTIMQIPDLTEMEVTANLSDVDDGAIEVGMRTLSTLDAYPDLGFPGVVREISPVAAEPERSPMRRVFRVTIALERSDPARMRPGMSVKVEVEPQVRGEMLLAPRAGLDLDSPEPRALLASGEERVIRLGACDASECVVVEGLREGDRLRSRG